MEVCYVSPSHPFMQAAAQYAASHSTDKGHPTGAVIVKDEKILSVGANQTPFLTHFPKFIHTHPRWCLRRALRIPSGKGYWVCPGCCSPKYHAEAWAIRKGDPQKITGGDLYLWGHWWACDACMEKMKKAGIARLFLVKEGKKYFA